MNRRRIAHAAPLLALVLALALLASPALGAKGGSLKLRPSPTLGAKWAKSRSGPSGCTQATPGVSVDNTWGWGQWGSWGLAGQERMYSVHVMNNDVGCGSSSFVINLSAPGGFSVSIPTSSITVSSRSSAYLSAHVTSPTWAANGDYPLTATVQRAGEAPAASFTSYYRVYSSDNTLPTLFWPNPGDGTSISGRSYNVTVSSNDDHQVTKIELYLDAASAPTATTLCDGIAYTCQLNYKWAIRRVHGQHTATFKSYDWVGNVGVLPVTFNVN
jgi:Bacterial Ig domain